MTAYWLYASQGCEGPYTPVGLLSRVGGDLNFLAAQSETIPKSRWAWKPAYLLPELSAPNLFKPLERGLLEPDHA